MHGAVLGGVNGLAIFSLTSALQALDAVVVFPTVSVGTILVSAWAGFALWKERFPRIALLGMAIGAAALVLVNL